MPSGRVNRLASPEMARAPNTRDRAVDPGAQEARLRCPRRHSRRSLAPARCSGGRESGGTVGRRGRPTESGARDVGVGRHREGQPDPAEPDVERAAHPKLVAIEVHRHPAGRHRGLRERRSVGGRALGQQTTPSRRRGTAAPPIRRARFPSGSQQIGAGPGRKRLSRLAARSASESIVSLRPAVEPRLAARNASTIGQKSTGRA